jgi:class 3 adenylate cyclase/tetratricopeptide (TPR) repeat protein
MKCPKCQFENPEGLKFCGECGTKLESVCPKCKSTNPAQFKFCGECGHNLTLPSEPAPKELSFDEKLKKIQKYLPTGITEKILAQRDKIEGERKQVTVMFCDMEGFTLLSEKLGPETMYSLMDQVYEILIHKVHDYDGTVNEMTGDGIMALFGAPIALEDAPQRAIRSALAVHREITKFSDQLKSDKGLPALRMRIGIHTGPVVVGTLGNDLRVEFKAVGDTVNLASRMEGLAEPGTTYVTEDTFNLTEGFFRFESLGEKRVKGKEAPVKVYQVIAPSTRRTRFDVSAERGLTPFIGRERELELLLDGFERVKAGKGQAFSIVSEAGCGKSRLLYEFRKAVANEDVIFLEGKCLSYGKAIAYHPHVDILKSSFDIQEEDGDQQIRERMINGLKALAIDEVTTLPYLLELLSVKDSGIDQFSMSPEAKKDRINEAIKRIVIKGSEIQPLVIAIEDLHWMDKGSEDVVRTVLESIAGSRVLVVLTYRPEFVPTWDAKSYHNQLTLHRLSNRKSLKMATNLLGTEEIDEALENLVLERTEGVPFFIEEFIRFFRDLQIIERRENAYHLSKDIQRVMIPSTIQDVIMARVDSLPERAKEVLQKGSVIEREFSYELIKHIMASSEQELLSNISVLKDSELIYERGIYPQSNYVFKHALTREVIYDSILAKRKKKLHEEIGEAIEALYRDNLSEHLEALSEHYFLSENYSKSADYSRLAGRKAEKAASLIGAIAYAKKRVTSLERLTRTEDVEKQIIDARAVLGLYYNQTNDFVLSKDAVEPVVDLAMKHGYKRRIAQVRTIIGSHAYAIEEEFSKAIDQLQEAINDAEATGDLISLVMANHWMGHVLADNCEFEKALYHLNRGLEINTMANVLWGISAHKSCIARTVYLSQGQVNMGYPMSLEGLETAEESGDTYSKAEAHISMGCAYLEKGKLKDAEDHLLKACEICERVQFPGLHAGAESFLGETYFSMEQYAKAKDHYAKCISIMVSHSFFPSHVRGLELAMARAMMLSNEKLNNLDALVTYPGKNKIRYNSGRIRRCLAEILLYLDDAQMGEAGKWIHEAIDEDRQNGLLFELARDLSICGEVYKRKGDRSKAQENLGKAIEVLKECGADGWVRKYEEEMAKLK